jgi:hydroxymethylglutaryl-CoA reductase
MRMKKNQTITGFSKLSKLGKIKWLVENFFKDPEIAMKELKGYWLDDEEQQRILDGFSENTISNYYLPYGIAPNFLINGKTYAVPMVIEESSVVAAASSAAKFWLTRGGFKASIIGVQKIGQVHFYWQGDAEQLSALFPSLKTYLIKAASDITSNMENRGGGVDDIDLITFVDDEPNYYQLRGYFNTCDSMGANFINTVLECWALVLPDWFIEQTTFSNGEHDVKIIMSILSNYTPQCLVRASVSCPISELGSFGDIGPSELADRFYKAIRIAQIDTYRATTHNKGIYNGIDSVALATGNDFRAIEACGHTYASKDGHYRSLSHCTISEGQFKFWLEVPLAVGTIGGLTKLHPVA